MSRDDKDPGQHVMAIMEEGKRFTMEVLRENEALRLATLKLKDDLRERDEQLRRCKGFDYEQALALLRQERDDAREKLEGLRTHLASVEAQNREFAARYERIEKQNGNLASLYVATYNLHATLEPAEVVRCIREIIINLIGSEMFGIYVIDEGAAALTLLAHEGLEEPLHRSLPGNEVVEQALKSNRAVAVDAPPTEEPARPIACVPLVVRERALGVIAIYRLLDHKAGFEAIDRELLEVLAGHAATALCSASLYAGIARPTATPEQLWELVRLEREA